MWLLLIASFLALSLYRNGLWIYPALEQVTKIAANIFVNPFLNEPLKHDFLQSFLGPILAYLTSAGHRPLVYLSLHLVLFFIFFVLIFYWIYKKYGLQRLSLTLTLFLCLPISLVLQSWMGSADIFSFLVGSVLAIGVRHSRWIFLLGLIQGLAHFEQGLFMIGSLFLFQWIQNYQSKLSLPFKATTLAFAGLVAGKATLFLWFWAFQFHAYKGRLGYLLALGYKTMLESVQSNLSGFAFSTLNIVWFFLAYFVFHYKNQRSAALILGACLLLILIPSCLGYDHTRLYAVISWPLLLYFFLNHAGPNLEQSHHFSRKFILGSVLLSLLVPPLVVWNGLSYASVRAATKRIYLEYIGPDQPSLEVLINNITYQRPMMPFQRKNP